MKKNNDKRKNSTQKERDPLAHVKEAEYYIYKNYSKPITIQEIADYAGISRSRLFRLFIEYRDISPKQFLTDYRIEMAYSYLDRRLCPVDVLSRKVGIIDPDRLSSYFKKKYGKTPSALIRKKLRIGPHQLLTKRRLAQKMREYNRK